MKIEKIKLNNEQTDISIKAKIIILELPISLLTEKKISSLNRMQMIEY